MTAFVIDLQSRYRAAFGLLAGNNQPTAVDLGYELPRFLPQRKDFVDVKMNFDGKEVKFASTPLLAEAYGEDVLATPPIISFSRSKRLVETEASGSDNVVVEKWGKSPWEIRLRGLLIDIENRHYPTDHVRRLNELFSYDGVVEVAGTEFYEKDIPAIYFKSIEINGVQGFQDTVQYTLTARSIVPVGFTLINP